MKKEQPFALLAAAFFSTGTVALAHDIEIDTLRNFEMDEAVVVASPKETAYLLHQPLSASMFGKADLEKIGASSIKNLSAFSPNFHMPDYGSRLTSAAYIRGVGARMNTPVLGLYVDNVAYTDKSAFDFSFLDVERVDVLRGPQSTLYGRNTMGGLIRVFTADPLKKTGTTIDLGGATHGGRYHGQAMTYLHPSDELGISVGGFYEGKTGFFDNVTTGKEADALSSGGGKLRMAWKPQNNLRFDWTASYEYSDEDACPYYLADFNAEAFPMLADKMGVISQNRQSSYRRGLFNTALSAEWKAPKFIFSSVTGYQNLDDRLKMDQDFTALDVFDLVQSQKINTFTEELSLRSRKGSRWQWTSGAFFMYQNMNTDCPVSFYKDGVAFLNSQFKGAPMKIAITNDELRFDADLKTPNWNAALFHQSTFNDLLVEGLSLTLGLRLEYDRQELDLASALRNPLFFTFQLPMPHAPQMNLGPVDAPFSGKLDNDSWQLLPKVALQYEMDKGNVFVSVTKGYRSGGYNIQSYSDLSQQVLMKNMMDAAFQAMPPRPHTRAGMPDFSDPDIHTMAYKAEESWNYELGGRFKLWNGLLDMDYSLFFLQTKNQQLARFTDSGLGRVMVNAGKTHNYGVELALRGHFFDNRLQTSVSYGYTHAELKDHDLGDADYSGNRVPFAPEHTVGAFAQFRQPLDNKVFKALYVGADVQGAGKIYWDEANQFDQPFYATLGANFGVELLGNVQLEFWGKNLTDTRYDTFSFNSFGNRFSQWGTPRHFGANLKLNF